MGKLLTDDSHGRQHRSRLGQLIADTNGPIRVATAYVTDGDLLASDRPTCLLVGVTAQDVACGATKTEPLKKIVESGVQVRYLPIGPRMHAKIYVFGSSAAVVTSANLTHNAFGSNIEIGVEVTGTEVSQLVHWFDRLWSTATPLTVEQLAKWQTSAKQLRQEYAALNKRASKALKLADDNSIVAAALNSDVQFYLCNTDRVEGTPTETGYYLEEAMHNRGFAAAWTPFKNRQQMKEVQPGDIVLMYAKAVGIIGIGRAVATCRILESGEPERLRDFKGEDNQEWRVPVEWLAWRESDPYVWKKSTPPTFRRVTQDTELRDGVTRHFAGASHNSVPWVATQDNEVVDHHQPVAPPKPRRPKETPHVERNVQSARGNKEVPETRNQQGHRIQAVMNNGLRTPEEIARVTGLSAKRVWNHVNYEIGKQRAELNSKGRVVVLRRPNYRTI
jgi:hypothetical protein